MESGAVASTSSKAAEKKESGLFRLAKPHPGPARGGQACEGRTIGPLAGPSTPELERVFRYLDKNGDGKISPAELRSYMQTMGEELSPEHAAAVVESTDSDGDGLLGFDDFVKLVGPQGEEDRRRSLRDAFQVYEMDGRECITPTSLKRALDKLGEFKTIEECMTMIRRFDINGDGVISFDEFKIMML